MKRIDLQSQETGIMTIINLFNTILEQSDYNLNQFVKGDSLAVSDEMPESFLESLKELVNISPGIVRNIENREKFWNMFEELDDYENNNKFVKWIQKYINASNKPFEEAAFLTDMDHEAFVKMTDYCFENLILKNIGKKRVDGSIGDLKQLYLLRKIIFTFIDMVIIENLSKENALENMKRVFGVKESYCDVWWKIIKENEDKLWKIMMMKQNRRIENKLNHLLEIIDE